MRKQKTVRRKQSGCVGCCCVPPAVHHPSARTRGFTLIELLVSITILTLLATLTYETLQKTNGSKVLETDALNVFSKLREARSSALASKKGSQWGVHIASSSVTLFQGPLFDAASATNVVTNLNSLVTVSSIALEGGVSNIVFERLTGATTQSGSTTLSLVASSTAKRTITIYRTGVIEMQ